MVPKLDGKERILQVERAVRIYKAIKATIELAVERGAPQEYYLPIMQAVIECIVKIDGEADIAIEQLRAEP